MMIKVLTLGAEFYVLKVSSFFLSLSIYLSQSLCLSLTVPLSL